MSRRLPPQFAALAARFLEAPGSYRLVDAHTCPYKDRVYTHFAFRDGARTLSLFLDDHPHGSLPSIAATDDGPFHVDPRATRNPVQPQTILVDPLEAL